MTDKPSHFELDDELLSAYLDGELSADERAAVEARLATDPAAQQLLHELRSVSQSVQALPTESVGRDLSEEILRRAREAQVVRGSGVVVRGSPDPAPSPDRRSPSVLTSETAGQIDGEVRRPAPNTTSDDTMPKLRIFNSRRAWIWASMALAAGLLVMIVQSGDESAKKLPPLAARNAEDARSQPAGAGRQPVRREIEISAPQSPSPPPATVAADSIDRKKVDALGKAVSATPMSAEPASGRSSVVNRDGAAAGSPVAAESPTPKLGTRLEDNAAAVAGASPGPPAAPGQVAMDESTIRSQPTGRVGGSSAERLNDAEKQKSESVVDPNAQRFVIVRVVARSEALKNGSVERLLADNKIEFVPEPAKIITQSFGGGRLAKPAASQIESNKSSDKVVEGHPPDTEIVLVDAPRPAIESCLADLNKNSADFLSVAVNESPSAHDRLDAKSVVTKKMAESGAKPTSLNRFSRGAAPIAPKDSIDLRKYFYSYDFDKQNDLVVNGPQLTRGPASVTSSGVQSEASGGEKLGYYDQPRPDFRRARSLETSNISNRQSRELATATGRAPKIQAGAEAAKQSASQQTLEEQAEAKANKNNNWKVLFVFTPADSLAPSARPADQPK